MICVSAFTLKICLVPLRLHHRSPFWEATTENTFFFNSKWIYNGADLTRDTFKEQRTRSETLTRTMTDTEMRSKNKSLPECTVIFIYWGKKYYYIICITLFWNVLIWLWLLYTRSLRNWIFEKQRVLSFLCCSFRFFSPLHSVYCCIHSFIHSLPTLGTIYHFTDQEETCTRSHHSHHIMMKCNHMERSFEIFTPYHSPISNSLQ